MWLWNFQGIFIFISWILNLIIIHWNDKIIQKTNSIGKRINRLCYYELVFIIVSMGNNIFYILTLGYLPSPSLLFFILVLVSLIGMGAFGTFLAFFSLKHLNERGVIKFV